MGNIQKCKNYMCVSQSTEQPWKTCENLILFELFHLNYLFSIGIVRSNTWRKNLGVNFFTYLTSVLAWSYGRKLFGNTASQAISIFLWNEHKYRKPSMISMFVMEHQSYLLSKWNTPIWYEGEARILQIKSWGGYLLYEGYYICSAISGPLFQVSRKFV